MNNTSRTAQQRDLVAERGVLGDEYTEKQVADLFRFFPPVFPEDMASRSYEERRMFLTTIEEMRVATRPVLDVYDRIRSSLISAYQRRDPLSPAYVRAFRAGSGRPLPRNVDASQLGFCVVGRSGAGKTTTVQRIMEIVAPNQIPDMHDVAAPGGIGKRVSYLFLPSSANGTRSGFLMQFFCELDRLLGTNYQAIPGTRRGKTVEAQIIAMKRLIRAHDIGMIVVDDVQQIVRSRAAAGEGPSVTMAFLLSLTNEIGVPVVFIGTEAFDAFLQTDMQLARRCEGLGQVNMGVLDDQDFDRLLRTLCRYQATDGRTSITPGIREMMSQLTGRYPGNVVRLWRQAQLDAIQQRRPCLTPEILDATMHQSFPDTFAALHRPSSAPFDAPRRNRSTRASQPDAATIEAEAVDALLSNDAMFSRLEAVKAVRQAMALFPAGTNASTITVAAIRILGRNRPNTKNWKRTTEPPLGSR
ncbi:MAG: AAA family ATPase [Candidatus Cryosericum sp.]